MSGESTASRHEAIAARARAYLDGAFRELPAGRRLGPRLTGAAVLVLGAHPLGLAGGRTPLHVEIVLTPQEWGRLHTEAGASELGFFDPRPPSPALVRLRGSEWLRDRLAHPAELWLRQRAAIVQDPAGLVAAAVPAALAGFRSRLETLVADRYREFRDGFESADAALEGLGRRVLLGGAVEAALALPLLCRAEPYPPPEYLVWHLGRVHAEGERIAGLCARAAAGAAVDRDACATLRRIIEEAMDAAGYGESLVRAYRCWE